MMLTPKQRIALAFSGLNYGDGGQPFQTYGAPGSFIPAAAPQPVNMYGSVGSFVPPASAGTTMMSARSTVPLPQARPPQQPMSLAPPHPTPVAPAPDPTNNPYGFTSSPAYMGQGSTGYGNAGSLFDLAKIFGGGQ